jgi:signal transduction histidine kinase
MELFFGKRPGEVLNCQNSCLLPTGCGTSCFCDTCGSLKVILSSLKGKEDVQECRIIKKDLNEAIDLRVWGKRLKVNDQIFSVFSFVDISDEKRRHALERIFVYDILNSAGALYSYFDLFKDSSTEEILEMLPMASDLIKNLFEEIKTQRALSQAENAELIVDFKKCNSFKIINNLNNLYNKRSISDGKGIEIDSTFIGIDFISDELLISRVLSNMIKYAMESSGKGSKIKIGCDLVKDKIRFFVNNQGFIPPKIQQQIFQRSFSTKGFGRGLGTYIMKLITERYLNGKISFKSTNEEGTTFIAEYPFINN